MSSKPIYKTKVTDTASFIKRAREVHGDKYDYSESVFINSTTKIAIWCYDHGWFYQYSGNHIGKKSECTHCAVVTKHRKHADRFVKKSKELHGDRYDYSKVEYVDNHTKVIIGCPEHGDFEQAPVDHTRPRPSGCPVCGNRREGHTRKQFIEKAIKVHGDDFNYDAVEYKRNHIKVKIYCNTHQKYYLQRPYHHLNGAGCNECGREKRQSHYMQLDGFISRSKEVHGELYGYDNVVYVNTSTHVEIECPVHGPFRQIPASHMKGQGCQLCANHKITRNRLLTIDEFIDRARKAHGDRYDYSDTILNGINRKTSIRCHKHGVFRQTVWAHMNGCGCQECAIERRSSISTVTPEMMDIPSTLYHVSFQRADGTSFEKIGITINSLKQRFNRIKEEDNLKMSVINTIEGTLGECSAMEQELLEIFEDHRFRIHDLRYHVVGGWTECFPPNIVSLFKSPDDEVEPQEEILL